MTQEEIQKGKKIQELWRKGIRLNRQLEKVISDIYALDKLEGQRFSTSIMESEG